MINQGTKEENPQKTIEKEKNLHKTSRQLLNQPVICPWTSRAPLPSSREITTAIGETNVHLPTKHLTVLNTNKAEFCQQSSSQFFHFLRLMQLFPDVHPATLHTVMTLCRNDFFAAVDKLLYAKKCKNYCMQRRNLWTVYNRNKVCRPQTYSYAPLPNGCIKIAVNNTSSSSVNDNQVQTGSSKCHKGCEVDFSNTTFVDKNRLINNDNKLATDLSSVNADQWSLPIHPLSPMTSMSSESYSKGQNEGNDTNQLK